jgi:hypothetical protein
MSIVSPKVPDFAERLFSILSHPSFLSMSGQANEVPFFIQTYKPSEEDSIRRVIESVAMRLRNCGISLKVIDLFDLVLLELEEQGILADLLRDEATFSKSDVLETIHNYSDPKTHLVPRLTREIGNDGTQLTLITGSGRIFPFLRTHNILESLQPAMTPHPIVILFPGEYDQDSNGGSHLKLFGSIPSPHINNAYYRATNLAHFRL